MRRILSWLLVLTVLLWGVVPARAADQEDLRQSIIKSFDSEEVTDLNMLGVTKQDSLPSVEISRWGITEQQLQQIFDELYYRGQLPWFVGTNYNYQITEDTVVSFTPLVLDTETYDRELYEQKIAELIAETILPGMTDWQKALSVHDYIVLHTAYDETYGKRFGYDALVNGTVVCNGYAQLYLDVMNRLGVPCQLVICEDTGDGEGHGWNLIQLEGQWYHVDLTWDDLSPDIYGYVSHEYFLKTSEEFRTGVNPHDYEWIAMEEAAQDPYLFDDFLEDAVSSVCFVDTVTAVYRSEVENTNQILSMDLTTGEETVLYEFDRMPMDLGDGTYLYYTQGMNFWNGRIYFNREDAVLSMLPDGSDVQEVYYREPDDRYLVSMFAEDGMLYLTLADGAFQRTSMEVELEGVEFHTHSYETHSVEATCGEAGFSEQVCSCGVSYNYKELPAADHAWNYEVIKEPTEEEFGLLHVYCEMCGQEEWEDLSPLPSTMEFILEEWTDYLPVLAGGAILVLIFVTIIRKRRR